MTPAEAGGDGPIDEEGFSNDVSLGQWTPITGVPTVDSVVAENDVMPGWHFEGVLGGAKVAAVIVWLEDVAAVLAFVRGRAGIEAIDVFKVRHGSVEAMAVDADMAVGANGNGVAGQADEAFDVEFVLGKAVDAPGFEDDDLTPVGLAKIICDSIDEEVVAGDFLHEDNGFAFAEGVWGDEAGGVFEVIIGSAPDGDGGFFGMAVVLDPDGLLVDEAQEMMGLLLDAGDLAVRRGDDVVVNGAMDGEVEDASEKAGDFESQVSPHVFGGGIVPRAMDSVKSGLHGAGGDLEGLEEKGADTHGDDDGNEENFDIFAPVRVRVGLDPFGGGFFQFPGSFAQGGVVGAVVEVGAGGLECVIEAGDGLRRKDVALGMEEFLDMFAHVGGLAEGGGEEPS